MFDLAQFFGIVFVFELPQGVFRCMAKAFVKIPSCRPFGEKSSWCCRHFAVLWWYSTLRGRGRWDRCRKQGGAYGLTVKRITMILVTYWTGRRHRLYQKRGAVFRSPSFMFFGGRICMNIFQFPESPAGFPLQTFAGETVNSGPIL